MIIEEKIARVFALIVVIFMVFIIFGAFYAGAFTMIRFHANGAIDCSSAAFDRRSYFEPKNYSDCYNWIASNCNVNVSMTYCGTPDNYIWR